MKQLDIFLIEKLKIDSKSKFSNIEDNYEEFGKGEFEQLDIEDFVKNVFDMNMKDNDIIKFYNKLKYYKIDPDTKFWHIPEKNVDKKIYTKIQILISKDSDVGADIMTINVSKNDALQIRFYNFPNTHLFIIVFVKHHKGSLINEYFLHYE